MAESLIMLDQKNQELKKLLCKSFVIIDNVPRNYQEERRTILEEKASLLIHASLWTERMFRFFRRAERSFTPVSDNLFSVLPAGVVTRRCKNKFARPNTSFPSRPSFSKGVVAFSLLDEHHVCVDDTEFELVLFLRQSADLYTDGSYPVPYALLSRDLLRSAASVLADSGTSARPKPPDLDESSKYGERATALATANAELHKRSLFEVCRGLGLFDSPENVCFLAGIEDTAFGNVFNGQSRLSPGHFGEPHGESGESVVPRPLTIKCPKGSTEADMVQFALDAEICSGHRGMPITSDPFEKTYGKSGFWQAVHSGYRDDRGTIRQKVLKLLRWDEESRTVSKVLLPRTVWRERGGWYTHQYCVPHPWELQPLYNQHLLHAMPDAAVVLTDSIEIAELNQGDSNFVWVSWLCEEGCYKQVDWSALSGRNFYCLVTNHSGKSLEEAYVEAGELLAHWDKKPEVGVSPCCFVQVCIDYPELRCPDDWPHSVIRTYDEEQPKVAQEGVVFMDWPGFGKNLERARAALRPRSPFRPVAEAPDTDDDGESAVSPGGYMLWPVVMPGCTTTIYAKEGSGKTNFTLAMAASIVAGRPFLRDRCWSVPVGFGDASVVYFDFESAGATDETDGDFVAPLLSGDGKEKEAERRTRFHRINMVKEMDEAGITKHWEQRENLFRLMLRRVNEQVGSGHFERPVLVVVDNYMAMVGGADASGRWGECSTSLFDRWKSRGAAVVVVNHANDDGKTAGYKACRRNSELMVLLAKEHGGSGGILEGIKVKVDKARGYKIKLLSDEFRVSFKNDTRTWELDEGQDRIKKFFPKLCLKLQAVEIGGKTLSVTEIGQMMGIGHTRANDYVKPYRDKRGGPINEKKLYS